MLLTLPTLIGCRPVSPLASLSLDDPRVISLLKARDDVPWAAMGFKPVTESYYIRLQGAAGSRYDAMLQVDGITSRAIFFRKTPNGFKWIGEQEDYTGPKLYTTPDGTFNESLAVHYQNEPVDGSPTDRTNITYYGEDTRLVRHDDLTLEYITPILTEWGYER